MAFDARQMVGTVRMTEGWPFCSAKSTQTDGRPSPASTSYVDAVLATTST